MKRLNLKFALLCLAPAFAFAQAPPPSPVAVAEALEDRFAATLWVPGTVISRHDAAIAAETDGRLTWVAEVGARIAEGEPLAIIDASDLELALDDSRAQLASLRARVSYQQANVDRLERLAAANNAAANQLDEARAELDMTRQDIRRAEVAVAQIQRRIEQTRVRAPYPGIVAERLVQAGEFVGRGAPVARLVDTEHREIRARAPLSVARWLREGLEVTVEHGGDQSLSPVASVIPVGDERSRMFELRVAASDPSWIVGSPVRIALPNSDTRELVALPRDALVLRGNETFVLRVKEDNTVERIEVRTGIGLGPLVEIIGDVARGDLVVTRGAERLRPGQAVTVNTTDQS